MASPQIKDAPSSIPDGYGIVEVSAEQKVSPLRIGVIVKKQADPVAGHLVMLRDLLDAQVYLGCVADASGRVQQWVELWVQSTNGLAGSLPASRETLSNAVLDDRWERLYRAFERLDAATIIRENGWPTTGTLYAHIVRADVKTQLDGKDCAIEFDDIPRQLEMGKVSNEGLATNFDGIDVKMATAGKQVGRNT